MLRRNRPVEEIAEDTGLTAEEVESLKTNRPISARDQIRSRAFFLLCRSIPRLKKRGVHHHRFSLLHSHPKSPQKLQNLLATTSDLSIHFSAVIVKNPEFVAEAVPC